MKREKFGIIHTLIWFTPLRPTHCNDIENQSQDNSRIISQIWRMYEKYYPDYTSGNIAAKSIPLLGLQRPSRYSRNNETQTRYSSLLPCLIWL